METVIANPRVVFPASRAWHWCVEGLRLWRAHPLRLLLLSVAPLLVEAILQAIPLAGMTLSKLIAPMFAFGVLRGLAEAEASGVLRWSCLWSAWTGDDRWRLLGLAALSALIVFGTQQGVVAATYGWPAVDAVLWGHMSAHPALLTRTFSGLLILPGIPLAVLLGLAPMFVLFRAMPAWTAMCRSTVAVCRQAAPFLIYAALLSVTMLGMLAVPFGVLATLFWLPWMTACSYVIWKDVRVLPEGQ